MIQIRTPVMADLEINASPIHSNEGDWKTRILNHDLSQMWTVEQDGKPMIIFGYGKIWDGVGSVWAIVSKDVQKHGVRVTLAFRRFIDTMPKSLGAHRVEMTVRSGETTALDWAKVLGFQWEATLKRYGADKSDYDLMVRHY